MMIVTSRCVLTVALISALASPSGDQFTPSDWTVHLRRVGQLAIGTSLDEVRRTLGDPSASLVQALSQTQSLPPEPDDSPCAYLVTKKTPHQIGLMFEKGVLTRIDIVRPGILTASGAQVGDMETRILQLYGPRIEVRQHHYPPVGAHYMIYTPVEASDRAYQMLFETDGVKVTELRIGLATAVAYVEGCA